MKRIAGIVIGICMWLSMAGVGLAEENYLGVGVNSFAYALQAFDKNAPQPGAKEFAVTIHGAISTREFIRKALETGWDVSFDPKDIGENGLVFFCNVSARTADMYIGNQTDKGIRLDFYRSDGTVYTQVVQSLNEVEKKTDMNFLGVIHPKKHAVRWESTEPYSQRYSGKHNSYVFNLYEKYSGRLQITLERDWDSLVYALRLSSMPKTTSPEELKVGALVMMEGKWMFFVTHVDHKNETVYGTTCWSDTGREIVLRERKSLKEKMSFAILPQKEITAPILF